MAEIFVRESREIAAPAPLVYGIIADYRDGHPGILPPDAFPKGLEVLRGGVGAGTEIRFSMTVLGRTREVTSTVTEPEPGRVLVETIPDGPVTRFVVEPLEGGERCRVTFQTSWSTRGVKGLLERLFAPAALRKIYRAEQALLAEQAHRRASAIESTRTRE